MKVIVSKKGNYLFPTKVYKSNSLNVQQGCTNSLKLAVARCFAPGLISCFKYIIIYYIEKKMIMNKSSPQFIIQLHYSF
ncbi:hypothetical protein RCL_jg5731.t1 [Rhizophagus clarus]|uniref:Uncharacterized protein n=1 Tax=Rhizophagus clarus TaxID=94130 RepID=A0A8H3R3J6_9GLOM|nr:hypothetical protein RCL_jg5731.t1 [Rhizophagus clarus]